MTKITIGVIGTLIFALAIAGYTIKTLYEKAGRLEQSNTQLTQTLSEQITETEELVTEIDRRDKAVLAAKRAKEKAERDADEIRRQRDKELAGNPWVDTPVPDAVVRSLQAGARPDQD